MQFKNNWIFWIPLFISIGILSYFTTPLGALAIQMTATKKYIYLSLLPIISIILYKKNRMATIYLISIIIGFYASLLRTELVTSPVLSETIKDVWVKGTVEDIQYASSGGRITLSQLYVRDLKKAERDIRIKVTVKTNIDDISIGDIVSFKGTLMPPMAPSIPDGFDYRTFAYYQKIGGTGYATSRLIIKNKGEVNSHFIEKLRQAAISRILEILPQPSASIASGMLVGDSSYLKQKVYEKIKVAGIAHVIAISGMHMVVVVSIIFFVFRWLCSLSNYISLRFDAKKVAAIISIIGSLFYLILAGNPVSAQRAYIMSSLVLLAIVLNRRSQAMHSLAISCTILLLLTPESLLNPSLQMSVAACFGLIWSYNFFHKFITPPKEQQLWAKWLYYMLNISFSTVVAGIFTAPFIIYHFHQFSTYSLLANLISIPLTDFFLMPLGMIGLALMPLGFDLIPFLIMEKGINIMLFIVDVVANLPMSSLFVPSISGYTMILFSYGTIILCVAKDKLRICGIGMIGISIISLFWIRMPDILIDAEGRLFAVRHEDNYYFSNMNVARFVRKVWQESVGENNPIAIDKAKIEGCTSDKCTLSKGNISVLILKTDDYECGNNDLIINMITSDPLCNSNTITLTDLKNNGAHAIWIDKKIKIKTSIKK